MSNIWNYGQYDLDKDALLKYLQSNLDSYMEYNGYDEDQKQQFRNAISDISTGITNGTITGDGFNKFHDNTGTIQKNDTTANAFGYIHTVANAMGKKFGSVKKKEDKENEKETLQQEMFDYNKHGLSYNFNRKYNPFGTDSTYSLWKSEFKSQEDLNNALLDYIGQHKINIQNSNYDFSKSQVDKDSYINMLTDLENDIKVDGISNSDQNKLKFLGLDPSNFILPTNKNQEQDPFGHIKWDNQSASQKLSEEAPTVPEGFKAVLQQDGSYEIVPNDDQTKARLEGEQLASDYLKEVNKKGFLEGFKDTDKMRMTSLAINLIAMFNPEPISSAAMGFASDTLDLTADEMDGINDSWWDDVANYGMSILTAVPIAGDALSGYKAFKSLKKVAGTLATAIGTYGAGLGISNSDEILQSINNIVNDLGNASVNDWRNVYTAVQLFTGGINMVRSSINKAQAKNVTKNAEEALVVQLKNNGKTENYQFSGKDKEDLLALKDNPEEFNKYIRENFEGLDKVEAAKIKTTKERDPEASKFNIFAKRKIKSQEVQTTTKPVYEQGKIPGKWDRARYFLDNTDEAVKPTRKQVAETPKADKQETKQETPKTESSETPKQEESVVKQQTETQKQETPKVEEQPKTTVEEPIKTEEKPDFSKAREAVSEKKSVKATEIEPDNKSKATEAADTKSEVAKYNTSNIRKEFDKLKGKNKKRAKWVLKNAKQNKEYADLVKSDPSYATADFNEMLAALQKADKKITYEQAFKMLTDAGYYKEGGIIKAQGGIKAPDWYKARYGNRTSLLGWTRDKSSQNWITDEHTFHGNADSLDTVYQANKAYTDDQEAVTSDIQNYYKSGENISDFINRYNSGAAKLRATWETDQSYNGNSAEHNPLFRSMFTSRSKMQKGNPLYNLNYQEDLQDKIGSTTWHRRMDTYEKEWEDLTDAEKLKRMHSIELGNDSNVWVYKKANGDIAQIEDQELERLLNYYPDSEEKVQTLNTGQDHVGSEQKQEKVEVPKPEKPNDSFFTPDKVLAAINYFRAIRHNNKQLDLANRMVPLLYDPVEHHRYVYGDLGAIAKGQEAAGQIRSQTSKPLTSDGSLATAQRLEGENLARQYILQGWQSDNETMRKMSELAWQQEKENRENRYNIAMKNRENMHQVSKEKLMALMTKERSDYESLTNHINEWRTWLAAKQKADSDKATLLYNRRLLNWVQSNPQEYISNWNLYEGVWNRYNNGEQLTANEQKTVQQIQSRLADAYYNEIYGKGDYFGYGITRAPWEVKFSKKGGRLTKSQVDTVIKFLKESNNNYNKAVDRSVRGLYNHIKLQRKK